LKVLIDTHTFDLSRHVKFAEFSGDFNLIHMDPVYARRSIAGECIVHGIHCLMYALNALAEARCIVVKTFNVNFLKTLPIGEFVECYWDPELLKLTLENDFIIYMEAEIEINQIVPIINKKLEIKTSRPLKRPKNLTLEKCAEFVSGKIAYRGNLDAGIFLFPLFFDKYGKSVAVELAITSEIVGMQIPGLNSLFLGIKGSILKRSSNSSYFLNKFNKKFGLIDLTYQSKHIDAGISTLFRRPHISQDDLFIRLKRKVKRGKFIGVNALIIGGSRGLGEITARIIAYGGGRVTITYNQGKVDALKIKQDILKSKGLCEIVSMDINDVINIPNSPFNQIYYFATPKIKSDSLLKHDKNLVKKYENYYLNGFTKLIRSVKLSGLNPSIFYPSTTFLDVEDDKFYSYKKIKLEGEDLCKYLKKTNEINIIYTRLPKMATDQTLGLMPEEFEDAVTVLYDNILKMLNYKLHF
jgi:hypothetical protein